MALQTTSNIKGGGGSGAVRLLFPALTGSQITDWDADLVDITGVTKLTPEFANKRKATEYESQTTVKGLNVRTAKKDSTFDAVTGTLVAAEGQASSLEFSFYANDTQLAKVKAALASSDQPVIAIWVDGDVAGNFDNDYHLLGYIDGNLGEDFIQGAINYTLKIVGGVGFTEDDSAHTGYIAAYKTTPGKLTPDGFDDAGANALELEDVVAGDVTKLLSGEIVEIARS